MSTLLSPRSPQAESVAPRVPAASRRVERVQRFDGAKVALAASLVVSVLLYLVHVRFPLVLACLAAGACLLPSLPALRSVVGRLFFSGVLFFAVFQIAATVQFLVLPSARFPVTAAITAVIYLAAVLLADVTTAGVRARVVGIWNRHDTAGAIVAAVFLLPFAPMLLGDNTVARIAQIGGSQAIDGTNHFRWIAQMMQDQHWTYFSGHYYPQSFHITVAFLQDALFVPQPDLDWEHSALLFMGQYLFFGVLLAAAVGYFLSTVLSAVAPRSATADRGLLLYAASCATGVVTALFLLLPFVQNGFLNYYYAITTILVGATVLLSRSENRLFSTIALYLVFIFGAGLSWPLLLPPLLGTLALVLGRTSSLRLLRALPKPQLAALAVLVALQFVPIAFQLMYSGPDASQGINLSGGLRTFHALSLLLSVGLVVALAAHRTMDRDLKDRGIALLLPLVAFVGVLALMQFFLLGEVRYYVIKTAFLLEAVNAVVLACLVAAALGRLDVSGIVKFATAAVVPAVVVFSLFAVTANPVSDDRDLFRTATGQVKPDFFDADLAVYTRLGLSGEITGFNTTLLHYDAAKGKYFAHMQIPIWSDVLQYDGTAGEDYQIGCIHELYKNLAFGGATDAEQQTLLRGITECARYTEDRGGRFVIVTDPASESAIRAEFGQVAGIEVR